MDRFTKLFRRSPAIIGMIHVRPLPGTPCYRSGSFQDVLKMAQNEAELLTSQNVDGLLIENMHDRPYVNRSIGPEVTSSMAIIAQEVRSIAGDLPCGVQILSGCNKEALAVAKAASLQFIRAEGFVYAHIADEGIIQSDAAQLLRYRKMIDAEDVLVFTDIKKKHSSHSITQDVSLVDTCDSAEMFLSDGIILTGSATGKSASTEELRTLLAMSNLPCLVGSGVTDQNFHEFSSAHALIVGSYFKQGGLWENELCVERIKHFMQMVSSFRDS